jgi:hypothetical protein
MDIAQADLREAELDANPAAAGLCRAERDHPAQGNDPGRLPMS